MLRKIAFILIIIIIVSSYFIYHTEYTLKVKNNSQDLSNEIKQFLSLIQLNSTAQITRENDEITIRFKTALSNKNKSSLHTLLQNTINTDTPTNHSLQLILSNNEATLLKKYLVSSNNIKEFTLTQSHDHNISALILYKKDALNLSSCGLQIPIKEVIPPLLIKIKPSIENFGTKRIKNRFSKMLEVEYPIHYTIKLNNEKELDISLNTEESIIINGKRLLESYLYYNTGKFEVKSDALFVKGKLLKSNEPSYLRCGQKILNTISKDIQNIFITPKLSNALISFESEDTFF